jgi:membrane protease YdiL (CAAX protease family)
MPTRATQRTVRNILLFTLLVNVLAWLGPVLGGDPVEPGPGFLLWGIAPLASCLIVRAVTRDWGDLGIRPGFREHWLWYVVSLLSYPAAVAIALGLGAAQNVVQFQGFTWPAFFRAFFPALAIYFVFALFEEFGWRGYLAPKMYSLGLNVYLAHALVAVIWASWHLPYIDALSAHTSEALAAFLPRFYLGCYAFTIVYGEIRLRTQSVWPAVAMHWFGNAIANPLVAQFILLKPGMEALGSPGIDGLWPIVFFTCLGVGLYLSRVHAVKREGS